MASEIIIFKTADGRPDIDVKIEDNTVWLTQNQMADLFQTTKQNISLHIKNILGSGELEEKATVKDYLTVQNEGKRHVERNVSYYNLDMIIAVGYRVRSNIGTQFRIWATNVIKAYLLRGKAENRELDDMKKYLANHERRLTRVEQGVETIVKTLLPPPDPPRRRIGFGGNGDTSTKPYGKK